MGERRRGPGSRGHRTRTSRREASARGLLELSPLALWRRLVDRLDEAYWPTPAACVALGAALSFALVQVDRGLARRGITVAFTGASDSALSLLSTIASSMLTLTALVFTITIVVLQLASTQFSPRALRTFLRDRQNQLTLGLFLATFVYALVALREVRGRGGAVEEFIPGLTITGSFALVLVSVVVFVHYIHHIAQSIRAVTIVERIGDETRATIAHLHPDEGSEEVLEQGEDEGARGAGGDVVVEAEAPGVVASVDVARLVEVATTTGVTARLVPCVGDFVATGMPLFRLEGAGARQAEEADLRATVVLARERDARQDVAFGFRQLVDIAERAVSPAVNDPSTACLCIDQMHDLLRRLAARPDAATVHRDDRGVVRAIVELVTWEGYVAQAFDELRHWGATSHQVRTRLQGMLDDLLRAVPEARRPPLEARDPLWDEPLPAGDGAPGPGDGAPGEG